MAYGSTYLFSGESLADALQRIFLDAAEGVMAEQEDGDIDLTDDKLVAAIIKEFEVEPVRFNQKVTSPYVSKLNGDIRDRDVTHVRGTVDMRFRGDDELFSCYPAGSDSRELYGTVCSQSRTLTLEACVPIEESGSLVSLLHTAVLDVKEVTDEQKLQIEAFKASLPALAREYVQRRNEQRNKFAAIEQKLRKIRI